MSALVTKTGAQWSRAVNWRLSADFTLNCLPLTLSVPRANNACFAISEFKVQYHLWFRVRRPKASTDVLSASPVTSIAVLKSARSYGRPSYGLENR